MVYEQSLKLMYTQLCYFLFLKKPQNQLVYLVEGKIFFFFIDLRPNSITFKKQYSLDNQILEGEIYCQSIKSDKLQTQNHIYA